MNKFIKPLVGPVVVSIILNLLLPALTSPFATKEQIKPPNGAAALPFFDQLMHMLVHHAQVPLTSSLIVALIVSLSTHFGKMIKL
tara:strand:- start:245 stop:499 length:255 start_codon:yes stop_codon:yes gene_type:complete